MRILRMPTVKEVTGYPSHSTIYELKNQGLFTDAVPLGPRAVGWPEHEVLAINKARIAGYSDDEIRALVKKLHAQRAELAPLKSV